MAIIRGETEKIDLSLNKYTDDLLLPNSGAETGSEKLAPTATATTTTAAAKYDAFKRRSFIYDDEGDDAPTDTLNTSLLELGAHTPLPTAKARSDSVDSLSMDFATTTTPTGTTTTTTTTTCTHTTTHTTTATGTANPSGNTITPRAAAAQTGRFEDDESSDGATESTHSSDSSTTSSDSEGDEDTNNIDEHDELFNNNMDNLQSTEFTDTNNTTTTTTNLIDDQLIDSTNNLEVTKSPIYKLPVGKKHRPERHTKPLKAHSHNNTTISNIIEKDIAPVYQFGSNYKKGGDSWIRKEEPSLGSLGTLGTTTPAKAHHHKPKQLIPTTDSKQPLARRHSNMINQCKLLRVVFYNITIYCCTL